MRIHVRQLLPFVGAMTLACIVLAGCGGTAPQSERTITVSATSKTSIAPDTCSFTVTLRGTGPTSSAAQKEVVEPTELVIKALEKLDVPESSIQTTYTGVMPIWDENGQTDSYEATTTLQISDVPVDSAGELMQAATDAGADEVGSLAYATSSYQTAYEDALAQAVSDARPKAEAIARAGNVSLGEVVTVVEGYQDMSYAANDAILAKATTEDAGGELSLAPGEVDVEAQVTVTYAIK